MDYSSDHAHTLQKPPVINFLQRRARISASHAKVVAELYGLPIDGWQPIGAVASRILDKNRGSRT